MNKKILITILVIIPISIFSLSKNNTDQNIGHSSPEICPAPNNKAKLAICPTFYNKVDYLDKEKFEIIKTNSSSESLNLLKNKEVDFVISGRTLLPEEGYFENITIGKGDLYYSFLSSDNAQINVKDFNLYNFYTDLDLNILYKDLGIKNIKKVNNVYEHLEKGVIITSWENTNLHKAKIVHVLNNDNSRLEISRIPTLYYQSNCNPLLIDEINKYSF